MQEATVQKKRAKAPSILKRPHREALDNGFPDEEGEDRDRQDDERRGGTDAGPVDLSVGDEVVDRHRHRLRLRPERFNEKRNWFQEKMKDMIAEVATAVSHQGEHDPEEALPAGAAVDHGRVLKLRRDALEEGDHQPDHHGHGDDQVGDGERGVGVDQLQVPEDDVPGEQVADEGRHPGDEDNPADLVSADTWRWSRPRAAPAPGRWPWPGWR